ncbi:polycystin-2-like protein 1 [Ptychodera flava]|uniref:polycystin-2-like protein 1 n=1 Tax=Ptychodera flava TaxID=63121 RepID=UPI00396A831A
MHCDYVIQDASSGWCCFKQFHRTDGANRAQYYDLHYLEPQKPGEEKMRTRMPMEVVVHYRQFDNIDHEVFRELLDVKWQRFGKRAAIIDFCIDLIYILLWTALAVIKPDGRGCYYFPGDVWRVILWALAISYTVFLIIQELMEYFVSKSEFNEWKEWKRSIISDDMKYCHPKWPHEKIWLDRELEETNNVKASYFHDYWNIFDWCVYILLVFCVIFHLIDIGVVSDELCWPEDDVNATADGDLSAKINSGIRISEDQGDEDLESVASMIHIRLFAITIIFVWIRLLKPTRAFMTLGPFIVMCYKILGDVARFSFLYMVFYIPYTSAFWMMFGGDVEEFETVSETLFSLFRLTLVDEYNYDGLKEENPVMCDILVGTYLAISAIVLLNLFIAMLSETFVRVHDNAHSNALMERAAIVLGLEDNLSDKKKEEYYKFIHGECSPRKKYYDDDMVTVGEDDDVRKITFHIKDQMTTLIETINNQADGNASSRAPGDMTAREASQAHEIRQIHLELNQIKMHQMESLDKTQKNMEIILNVLNEIASQSRGSPVLGNPRAALTAIHDEYGDDDPDRSRQDRHHPKRGRHKDEFQSFGSDRDGK